MAAEATQEEKPKAPAISSIERYTLRAAIAHDGDASVPVSLSGLSCSVLDEALVASPRCWHSADNANMARSMYCDPQPTLRFRATVRLADGGSPSTGIWSSICESTPEVGRRVPTGAATPARPA